MNTTMTLEDRLLATHISDNAEFESACLTGDGAKILSIVNSEMQTNNLHSKGANKLKMDIYRLLQGNVTVSRYVGMRVMTFVWNSRLKGIGYAVAN